LPRMGFGPIFRNFCRRKVHPSNISDERYDCKVPSGSCGRIINSVRFTIALRATGRDLSKSTFPEAVQGNSLDKQRDCTRAAKWGRRATVTLQECVCAVL